MEGIFRKRKQKGLFWTEPELEKMMFSVISTFSFLQSLGICHRDIKPANLFIMNNFEIKVIDFGESKEATKDDENDVCMATIR